MRHSPQLFGSAPRGDAIAAASRRPRPSLIAWCAGLGLLVVAMQANGQGTDEESRPTLADDPAQRLVLDQGSVADRFRRLEQALIQRAEFAEDGASRTDILRRAFEQSRGERLAARFESTVELLGQDRVRTYDEALTEQVELQKQLKALLDLLQSEDRSTRLEEERERIRQYLKEINRMLRQQQGLQSRSGREGEDLESLADRQADLADDARRLAENMMPQGETANSDSQSGQSVKESSGEEGNQESGSPNGEQGATESPSDGDAQPSEDSGDGEKPSDEDSAPPNDGETPAASSPGDSSPSEESADPSQPSESAPGQPSESQPGQSGESSPGGQPSPQSESAQRVQEAQRRMRIAEEKLRDAEQREAVEEQRQAVRELELAREELERILRQMREEEIERMLADLETRLRRMLQLQIAVYEATERLTRLAAGDPSREQRLASANLARDEGRIVLEADRTLLLLRDDGTSAAFPESVEQLRSDMASVQRRLSDASLDSLTIAMEEDVIAALEEMIAAVETAQREQEQNDGEQQQQSPSEGGEPQDEPLITMLAELRMLRSLQVRINRRTEQIAEAQPQDDLQEMLDELSERQRKLYETTRALVEKKTE